MKNIFIGAAWPYANNNLHIGHIAALLPGDVISRFHKKNGDRVIFVSGTDSHGTPVTVRAKNEKKSPNDIAKVYHEEFKSNFSDLDIDFDLYTATTTDFHKEKVQQYIKKIIENGYVYEKEENQDFCGECKTFLSDREVVGVCVYCGGEAKGDQCDSCLRPLEQSKIVDKVCKQCGQPTITKKNKHLYFKLSDFQSEILNLVEKRENKWRKNAEKESKKFLDMGLIDRAVTRQLDWGVPVPADGYEDKRIYVWFEAVLGYLTAGQLAAEQKGYDFDDFIYSNELTTYFVHGKDNIPFHTVIYPALLLAIDKKIKLPEFIISSEYVNMNNEKMSKSKGNLITASEMISRFPTDTIRYYILAHGPEKKDINFSISELIQIHNKFLVGVIGNFVNRNLSFLVKKFDGKIIQGTIDCSIRDLTNNTYREVADEIARGNIKKALDYVVNYATAGNKFYDDKKPWIAVNDDISAFNDITYTCIYMIVNLANLIEPFLPQTSLAIKSMLEFDKDSWKEVVIRGDIKVNSLQLLFNRIDEK